MRRSLLLAFDTSASVGSVALARGTEVLASRLLVERSRHASRLVPAIAQVLDAAGVSRDGIEGIVVGRGPGSFTGVRIAAATARGLAAGLRVPVWAWSSLAAAAASHRVRLPRSLTMEPGVDPADLPQEADGWPRYVLFDARGRRVYAACYRILPDRVEVLVEPRATTVDRILAEDLPPNVLFCGDGALRHAGLLTTADRFVLPLPAGLPTAEGLLKVHARQEDAPPLEPGSGWEPEYLRSSSAVRAAPAGARRGGAG